MLVPPSPKLHCHAVGTPVELSVNWTAAPTAGAIGLKLNEAVGTLPPVATVIVRRAVLEPELPPTVRETV